MSFDAIVFWIILIVGGVWLYNKFLGLGQHTGSSYSTTRESSVSIQSIEIPQEANAAVSRFAWLCNLTRRQLRTMDGLREDYFSTASIRLSFGKTDTDAQASFRFSFDYSLHGLYKMMGFELGKGLSIVDSDGVEYSSSSIEGLKAWGGMISGYNEAAAQSLLELVALTFTNECPDAYVHMKSVSADALYISFKFR